MSAFDTDTFHLTIAPDRASGIISANAPLHRGALHQFITHARIMYFAGMQVPFRVIATDPATGVITEEHIPGCATCSVGG